MSKNLHPDRGVRLLGDVGGTHIRLGWQAGSGAPMADVRQYRCADFPGIEAALGHYLREAAVPKVSHAALGIANPVTGDEIRMTNHDWQFSVRQLQAALGLDRLLFINDFTALALALPDLQPQDLRQVGGHAAVAGEPRALLGPGTGLGMSGLVRTSGGWQALAGEGGHATLAAQTEEEWQVIRHLARRHGHVSAERALSGPGLVELHEALQALQGQAPLHAEPAEITQAALAGEPQALACVRLFCGLLGSVAGNLALTLGARGGVYLGGGIVPRLGELFDASLFRERFEAKGRFAAYLAPIPCWVITARTSPALLGAARALDQAA